MSSATFQDIKLNEEKGNRIEGASNQLNLSQDRSMSELDANSMILILKSLDEIEQLVLSLHYEQSLNFREIGAALGICGSKAMKIFNQATQKLLEKSDS